MRKHAIGLAAASGAVLVAMVAVGVTTGATQEIHEHVATPEIYMRDLLAHPGGLRLVMGLDVGFLVLYTGFFAALAGYLRARGQPRLFVDLALAAMLGVALLDIVEDHHILALLAEAERGIAPTVGAIAFQATESATKFSLSYLSLVMFGLSIPRTSPLAWVLAAFLTVGTLATGIAGFAAPPDVAASLDNGRWIGFLAGFVLAIAWLVREREADADVRARA